MEIKYSIAHFKDSKMVGLIKQDWDGNRLINSHAFTIPEEEVAAFIISNGTKLMNKEGRVATDSR